MKWLEANKCKPVYDNRVFIRAIYTGVTENSDDRISDIYTGYYSHEHDEWVINGIWLVRKNDYTVTHFAIPDTIEFA